eukprot:722078_1
MHLIHISVEFTNTILALIIDPRDQLLQRNQKKQKRKICKLCLVCARMAHQYMNRTDINKIELLNDGMHLHGLSLLVVSDCASIHAFLDVSIRCNVNDRLYHSQVISHTGPHAFNSKTFHRKEGLMCVVPSWIQGIHRKEADHIWKVIYCSM